MMRKEKKQSAKPHLDPEKWVDDYAHYLYNFALGRLHNRENAENAVQETFLAALKARNTFSGRSTERTWLIGILKHKIIDTMRKSYRERPVTDLQKQDDAIDGFFDLQQHPKKFPSDWLPEPKELLSKKEFWQIFHECLAKLPKTPQDAFYLREIEKLDSHKICEILKITESNLWVLLHRARLQLRHCLEVNWFERPES